MFNFKSLSLVIVFFSSLIAIDASENDSQGIHKCSIDKTKEIVLVKDGQACSEIVIEKKCSPVVKFAAMELKNFIKDATGAEVKIVNSRNDAIAGIVLGESKLAKEAGLDVSKLPRDGFYTKSINNTVFIVGRDDPQENPENPAPRYDNSERATLFGVYDFLERFAGIKFYFPGKVGTVVPQYKTLSIPMADITESPDFPHRRVGPETECKYYDDDGDKIQKLNMLRLRSQTKYIPNCHSLARSRIVQRFGESKPEFFALLSNGKRDNDLSLIGQRGHLCFTNKELENEIYEDAVAFLTGKPAKVRPGLGAWNPGAFQPGYFNIMPQDGHGPSTFCHCPECWKYYGAGKAGELVWTFVANIAERLKKNNVKGYVTAMAYGPYREVPAAQIPDNVLVMLALTGPWMEKESDVQVKFDRLIRDWNLKIAPNKVWLWNYANKHGERMIGGIPASTPRCVGSYYKRNAPYITGAFLQSDNDFYIFNYLNYYVFFKLAWNNAIDVDALLKEHDKIMFGPAAEQMGKFYSIIENLWTCQIMGKILETPTGPKSIVASEAKIFTEIYSESVISGLNKLLEDAETLTVNLPEYANRVKFIRKNFLDEIIKAREDYMNRKRKLEDLVLQAFPVKDENIKIDGKIDDIPWGNASFVSMLALDIKTRTVLNAEKALVKTKVHGLWNAECLYLAFECEEPEISKMSIKKRKNDDGSIWQDASIEILLNPSGDRRTYYQLLINPYGSLSDLQIVVDDNGKRVASDWNWNSNAIVKTNVGKSSWTAEVKIPFSCFNGFPIKDGVKIAANFCRSRNLLNVTKEQNQLYTWSCFVNSFHNIDNWGYIQLSPGNLK